MLPSPPSLIFSVHMLTLLLTVLEKTVIEKIEIVTLTSLTKMKSVDVLTRNSYDQPTSGFEHWLRWHQVLHSNGNGNACIVNSDDPAEWAKAIEAVRLRHGMRLQEIKSLRASYGEKYSWEEQCEALVNRMQRMGHGKSYLLSADVVFILYQTSH